MMKNKKTTMMKTKALEKKNRKMNVLMMIVQDCLTIQVPPNAVSVLPESNNGILYWILPTEFAQGTYNGRNGSNACSVICLLLGHFVSRREVELCNGTLPSSLLRAIAVSISSGNKIYDLCRDTLPSRFLTVEEASKMLPSGFEVEISVPLPVRLRDPHHMSTVFLSTQYVRL